MRTIFHRKRHPCQKEDDSQVGEELLTMGVGADSAAVSPPTTPNQPFCDLALPQIDPVIAFPTILLLYVGCIFSILAGCTIGSSILGALCVLGAVSAIPNNNTGDESHSGADASLYEYASYL